MIGTAPANYAAPAVAYDMDTRRQIVAGILPDIAGDYEDIEGAREAARERARLRKKTSDIKAVHDMDLTEFHASLNVGHTPRNLDDPRPANVVQPQFSGPLHTGRQTDEEHDAIIDDFWERQFAAQNNRKADV